MNQVSQQLNTSTKTIGRDAVLDIVQVDNGRLLNPAEVSKVLGVAVHTLAVWRCNKRYSLPYVKIGSRCMYRESDVLAFIDSRTEGK
ncbi:MAG: helix-turn-helix domain-containing protein [Oleiphilus sp.]